MLRQIAPGGQASWLEQDRYLHPWDLIGWLPQMRQGPPQSAPDGIIPTCTLRCHSKMGKIGQRVKKLRIVLKLSQLIAKGVNNGIKGDKDPVRKSFFS